MRQSLSIQPNKKCLMARNTLVVVANLLTAKPAPAIEKHFDHLCYSRRAKRPGVAFLNRGGHWPFLRHLSAHKQCKYTPSRQMQLVAMRSYLFGVERRKSKFLATIRRSFSTLIFPNEHRTDRLFIIISDVLKSFFDHFA